MESPKGAVRRTAVIVGVAYSTALWLSGVELDNGVKQLLAYLPTVLVLAVVAFDVRLWRLPVVTKLHSRPRIDGLWRVTLKPDGRSLIPDGGNRGPIEGYLAIQQTFWSVAVTLFTAESRSDSRAADFLRRNGSKRLVLSFTYDNQPKRDHLEHGPRSAGASDLAVPRGSPTAMDGHYFTDRFTAGSMELTLIDRNTDYESFATAKKHADECGSAAS